MSSHSVTAKKYLGIRFERLTIVEYIPASGGRASNAKAKVRCVCECGNGVTCGIADLKAKKTKSCGCLRAEKARNSSRILHSHVHDIRRVSFPRSKYHAEYRAWQSMKYRCLNIAAKDYKDYGARGIKIFPSWVHSFKLFIEYINPMPEKGSTLDRINNDGNYEPGNVRWASRIQQANNRRPKSAHKATS